MTDKIKFIIFLSGNFSEMGVGTEKGQFASGQGHKIMMEVGVYFRQEIHERFYFDQADRLQ